MVVRHSLVQVHKLEDGTVGVFSRNSEDMSKKYPDLVEQLPRVLIFAFYP
jgi:DNA ligase-1